MTTSSDTRHWHVTAPLAEVSGAVQGVMKEVTRRDFLQPYFDKHNVNLNTELTASEAGIISELYRAMALPSRSCGQTPRDNLDRRSSTPTRSPLDHQRRSWTDNGVHYTMESASYSSPGITFGSLSGGAGGLLNDIFTSPTERVYRHQTAPGFGTVGGSGLFGTALGLIDGLLAMQQHGVPDRSRTGHHNVQIEDLDDEGLEDDDLAYDDSNESLGGRSHRSMSSRFKNKLREGKQRSRTMPYSREPSPVPRLRNDRRQASHGTEPRPTMEDTNAAMREDDEESYGYDHHQQKTRRSRPPPSETRMNEALENAAEFHRNEAKRCRKQLERASRQQTVHSGQLQGLLNELKMHERSLASAMRSLQAAKADENETREYHTRPSRPKARAAPMRGGFGIDDPFKTTGFGAFFDRPRPTHVFSDFDDGLDPFANAMFGHMHRHFFEQPSLFDDSVDHNFFGMPGAAFANAQRKRPRFARADTGKTFRPADFGSNYRLTPPRPPPTLLTPDEAKQLFNMYNDQWNTLSPTDPNIPYPTRGLYAPALLARDTLWAPLLRDAHPATWSEDTVMQANAQAFFLNVVGLTPQYTEAPGTGRVQMSFEKTRASQTQIKQLIDLLKKEKTRWHSDRLGRRDDGRAGPNTALQNDERARAVFHAVCELMEDAQS